MADMSCQAAGKCQKKPEKEMKTIEHSLLQVDLSKLADEFPESDFSAVAHLSNVLSGRVVGRCVCHLCYDEVTQKKVLYNARIDKQKQKNSNKYVDAYWDNDECEDDAVE